MDAINYMMNIQEYRDKLLILSEQAKKDERFFLCQFLDELLTHQPENVALLDYIYKSADDITKAMTDCYMILLNCNAELVWYELISFVNEEKEEAKEFFDGLLDCFKHKVDVELVKTWISESISAKAFAMRLSSWCDEQNEKKAVPAYADSGEPESERSMFIEHLKDENKVLNARLIKTEKELSAVREEMRETLNDSFSNRKAALENRLELEQLKKTTKSTTVALKFAESKLEKYQSMCRNMESTIKQLRESRAVVEDHNTEITELQTQIAALTSSLDEKNIIIGNLTQELSDCKMKMEQLQSKDSFSTSDFTADIFHEPEPESDFGYDDQSFSNMDIPDFFTGQNAYEEEDLSEGLDYNPEEIIEIKDGREEIVRHSNLFTKIFTKHQQKKFEKKTVSEQESLIFVKMMENNFSKDMVQTVKNAMKSNAYLSRFEIYELISNRATEQEISSYCGIAV